MFEVLKRVHRAGHAMGRLLGLILLGVCLLWIAPAQAIRIGEGTDVAGDSDVLTPSRTLKRIHIFVERMDADGIVSEDGRVFRFSPGTRITGEKQAHGKKRIAELVYDGDRLVHVILR